jgi:tRNA(Ile2) C34 agmatinyltransferase TiaS
MDYKKEIIKILEDEAVLLDEGYGTTGITEDEHEKIADRIVKLFAIPHVVRRSDPLFCPNCNSGERINNDGEDGYKCNRCGTRWAK